MKLRRIALATAGMLAFAGPALAASGDQPRTGSDSTQAMQEEQSGAHSPPQSPVVVPQNARRGEPDASSATYGSSTVREAQQALQEKGIDVGPVDGIWGPKTASAVREFQQRQGMTETGRLDRETLAALDVEHTSPSAGRMGSRSDQGDQGRSANSSSAPDKEAGKSGGPGASR